MQAHAPAAGALPLITMGCTLRCRQVHEREMIEVDGAASERLLQPKMPPGVLTEGAVVDVRLRNSCASFALMIAGLILVPTGVLASSTDCSKIKSTTVLPIP